MELFDIINKDNQIIGETNDTTCHVNGDLHRVVAIFVFTPLKEMYVQIRKDDGKLDHSVGGHVVKGETFDHAAAREGKEELGIVGAFSYLGSVTSSEKTQKTYKNHLFAIYEFTVDSTWQFRETEEVAVLKKLSVSEILSEMEQHPDIFTKGFIATMHAYINIKNKISF